MEIHSGDSRDLIRGRDSIIAGLKEMFKMIDTDTSL